MKRFLSLFLGLLVGTGAYADVTGGITPPGGSGGSGVSSVSVVTANGVSGSVATATTTPAITLTVTLSDGSVVPIYSTAGTAFTLLNESANMVFAGPTTGSAAQPTFRSLVAADLPATLTSGGNPIPQIPLQSGIPFVISSSGTMGNNGALSAVVAMNRTIGNSYAYFPANTICTANTAGWYWTVWSSTTAATVFNNTYTSGQPEIVASPTAFVCTAGTFTQTTVLQTGPIVTIPAGAMGVNGGVYTTAFVSYINNADAKTVGFTFNGNGAGALANTTTASNGVGFAVVNQGVTNKQVATNQSLFASASGASVTTSVDTTASVTSGLYIKIATAASDYIILESYSIELRPHS